MCLILLRLYLSLHNHFHQNFLKIFSYLTVYHYVLSFIISQINLISAGLSLQEPEGQTNTFVKLKIFSPSILPHYITKHLVCQALLKNYILISYFRIIDFIFHQVLICYQRFYNSIGVFFKA